MTSDAGYVEQAPRYYVINEQNLTGSRLYKWCGERYQLMVTNACPELVKSAKHRGKPDRKWLSENLRQLHERTKSKQFDLLLVCGKVAQDTYNPFDAGKARIIELPHPAARMWTRNALALVGRVIQQGEGDCCLSFSQGRLISEPFIPF